MRQQQPAPAACVPRGQPGRRCGCWWVQAGRQRRPAAQRNPQVRGRAGAAAVRVPAAVQVRRRVVLHQEVPPAAAAAALAPASSGWEVVRPLPRAADTAGPPRDPRVHRGGAAESSAAVRAEVVSAAEVAAVEVEEVSVEAAAAAGAAAALPAAAAAAVAEASSGAAGEVLQVAAAASGPAAASLKGEPPRLPGTPEVAAP